MSRHAGKNCGPLPMGSYQSSAYSPNMPAVCRILLIEEFGLAATNARRKLRCINLDSSLRLACAQLHGRHILRPVLSWAQPQDIWHNLRCRCWRVSLPPSAVKQCIRLRPGNDAIGTMSHGDAPASPGDMTPAQQELLWTLLRAGLSEQGVQKTRGVVATEAILGELSGSPGYRDPGNYAIVFFGTPPPCSHGAGVLKASPLPHLYRGARTGRCCHPGISRRQSRHCASATHAGGFQGFGNGRGRWLSLAP